MNMSASPRLAMGNTAETSIEIEDSESEAEEFHTALDTQQELKESARDTAFTRPMRTASICPSGLTSLPSETSTQLAIIDNPFLIPIPPKRVFLLEGPKNMLMIEAPPSLKDLPRVVDRMDDIDEEERDRMAKTSDVVTSGCTDGGLELQPWMDMDIDEEGEEGREREDQADGELQENHQEESEDEVQYTGTSKRKDSNQVKPEPRESDNDGDNDPLLPHATPVPPRKTRRTVKPRKVGGSRIPAVPEYRYPAGKMTAEEFIAAADTFHLVVEQEGSAGRIGRALLEFDLKPRKFSTGSYGWCGALQGALPTNKGNVQIRTSVNLIVKGSKPIVVAPRVPAGRK